MPESLYQICICHNLNKFAGKYLNFMLSRICFIVAFVINFVVTVSFQFSFSGKRNYIATKILSQKKQRNFYHDKSDNFPSFPDSKAFSLFDIAVDNAIMYWDGALTKEQCDKIILNFEISSTEQYTGEVYIDGILSLDPAVKKNTEIHITEESTIGKKSFKWFETDKLLSAVVTKYLGLYQDKNIVIATQKNPMGDEGFRMKRYLNDGTEHHAYHSDSGHELATSARRIIAVLIYLNDVTEGGETVFLNQGVSIKPVIGRITLFPTSYSFLHAGKSPVSNSKYVIINFLTI